MSTDLSPLCPARVDVVVVGGGASGLSAATELVDAGLTVTVLEARGRIGGRALSLKVEGGTIDFGATWFWANEPLTRSLTDRLDLTIFDQYLSGDALFDAGQVQRLDGNPLDSPASRFASGAQSLLDALAQRLPGGALRLGETVESITVVSDGIEVRTRTQVFEAQHVVLAMPPALAAETVAFTPDLPSSVRQIAEHTAVWMGGMIKAVAVFDAPFWRTRRLSGSAISHTGPFREFHDHSGPGGTPAAIFGFAPATGLPTQDENGIAAAFRAQLVRLFGTDAEHPREVHVANWSTQRYTQPTRTAADTSTYGHPVFGSPVHRRIHWASTETAPAFAGHLEGAVLAVIRAADSVRNREPAAHARRD